MTTQAASQTPSWDDILMIMQPSSQPKVAEVARMDTSQLLTSYQPQSVSRGASPDHSAKISPRKSSKRYPTYPDRIVCNGGEVCNGKGQCGPAHRIIFHYLQLTPCRNGNSCKFVDPRYMDINADFQHAINNPHSHEMVYKKYQSLVNNGKLETSSMQRIEQYGDIAKKLVDELPITFTAERKNLNLSKPTSPNPVYVSGESAQVARDVAAQARNLAPRDDARAFTLPQTTFYKAANSDTQQDLDNLQATINSNTIVGNRQTLLGVVNLKNLRVGEIGRSIVMGRCMHLIIGDKGMVTNDYYMGGMLLCGATTVADSCFCSSHQNP